MVAFGGLLCLQIHSLTDWWKSLSGEVSHCRGFQRVLPFTLSTTLLHIHTYIKNVVETAVHWNSIFAFYTETGVLKLRLNPLKSTEDLVVHTIFLEIANINKNRIEIIFGKVVKDIFGCIRWA